MEYGNPLRGTQATTGDARAALLKQAGAVLNMFEGTSRQSALAEYRAALARCTDVYRRIEELRPQYKKQSIVLEGYLQKDKLRDYMELLSAFTQAEPKPTDTAEKLAVKGYSNHLFVIRCTLERINGELAEYISQEPDTDNLARHFLGTESAGQPLLEQWQQLRSRISVTFKNPAATSKEYAQRISELDELEIAFRKNREAVTAFLTEKHTALLQRAEKMEAEIAMGEKLYPALTALFTDELFDRFDPDSNPAMEQDIQLVRDSYRALSGQLQQLLTEFPRR